MQNAKRNEFYKPGLIQIIGTGSNRTLGKDSPKMPLKNKGLKTEIALNIKSTKTNVKII